MSNYRIKKTSAFELRGLSLLKSMGFGIEANNTDSNAIDYRILKDKNNRDTGYLYVDFQYSSDFIKYGDIRIDIISAYEKGNQTNYNILANIKSDLNEVDKLSIEDFKEALQGNLKVQKFGKLFDKDLNSIIFFVFNQEDKDVNVEDIPDIIAIIPRLTIENFIVKYHKSIFNKIKLNDKSKVGDKHGSAFIAITFASLYAFEPFFIIYPKELKETLLVTK